MKYIKAWLTVVSLICMAACGGGNKVTTTAAASTPAAESALSLFTSAPSPLTFPSGAPPTTYTIGGGVPPFAASSSNTSVATASVSGTTLSIASGVVGTASILVLDSKGAKVEIALTVGSTMAPALFTTAPSAVSMQEGAARSFTIGGGSPPFSGSSSNSAVADLVVIGNAFTVKAGGAGSVELIVLDASGSKVTVAVTVTGSSLPVTPLRSTAPAAIALVANENASFTIIGGSPPYAASSSNAAVATVALTSPEIAIKGFGTGTSQILVIDSTGTQLTISVTVGAPPVTALTTTAPATITLSMGAIAPSSYTIFGGTPPYMAVSSNTSTLTAATSGGNKLDLSGVSVGNASVEVIDTNGLRSLAIAVTVLAQAGAPLSVAPSGATGNVGDLLTFKIIGGTSPYAIDVSNVSIATASPNSVLAAGGNFNVSLLNVGNNIITVRDAQGQTTSLALTVLSTSPAVRLSPSAFTVAENNLDPIILNIYGGTPPYRALTSDSTKSNVPAGNIPATTTNPPAGILSTTVGTSNTRCINPVTDATPPVYIPTGTFDVTFTVLDSLGASASSVMTIKDNGAGLNLGCAPTVSSVAITSATGIVAGNLTTGNVVSTTLTTSRAITVTGTPQLALNIGGTTVQADFNSGSGTTTLVFNYTILPGQTDTNGISIAANSLSLNGGTMTDATFFDASLAHKAVTDNINFRVNTP
jgi:hypothetical protein